MYWTDKSVYWPVRPSFMVNYSKIISTILWLSPIIRVMNTHPRLVVSQVIPSLSVTSGAM